VPTIGTTVDEEELRRFAERADTWWDPEGGFRTLHRLNPARLDFIRSRLLAHFRRDPGQLQPFTGITLLDVGCGGGLVAEPMARLGFTVTGADAEAAAIAAAQAHAGATGLHIDYRIATPESLAVTGERFDAVLALEVIEHVADPDSFYKSLGMLVTPGGAVIVATINRTVRSFYMAIVMGEYIFGLLPRGTHDWGKFLRPSEVILGLRRNHLRASDIAGVSYDLRAGEWALSRDIEVNYLVIAVPQ
jgi:2-polyprenyl-6-hydroxyphenyl methylase / 3-demethylubiquinone-9 3-methyltransferase